VPTPAPRVLVVDDEPAIRTLVRKCLLHSGYAVTEAEDGAEALRVFGGNESFDLVLSDLVMPHVDGWELARRLRETRPDLPLLFMSGHVDDAPNIDGRAYMLVRKPFRVDTLVRAVDTLLREAV
jgi:two-component system cell cycle sensor histidine kinase/response regulator CckA